MTTTWGDTSLPPEQFEALKKAKRLQVVSLVYVASAVALVVLVMGSSQAMKAAWIEDLLSILPPLSFLVAAHLIRRRPDRANPYGYHRAVGVAHLASSVALLTMGLFVVGDSAMTLLSAEHPTIGTMNIVGHTVWQGWPMMAVLLYTGVPNVIIGRMKKKLAEKLHDKVLYADASMNSDDWLTATGAMVGVVGIGLGLWWADSVVAILIGASVVRDGLKNVGAAVHGLTDGRALTYDDSAPHPTHDQVLAAVKRLDWVDAVGLRMRDEGHVFHAEVFVVPQRGEVTLDQVARARDAVTAIDWKLDDVVIVPVTQLPVGCTR